MSTTFKKIRQELNVVAFEKGNISLDERELTDAEKDEVEKVAKSLPDAEFKKRYGDKWLSVKIATATNIVKDKKKK